MSNVRVLLADDHVLMRHGLRKILEDSPGFEIVAEASDGHTAVSQAVALHPQVAILDVAMPLLNGIEAANLIARRAASVAVLILSMHDEQPYVMQAMQAGARGYVLKDSAGKDLLDAVRSVCRGETYFSPRIAHLTTEAITQELTRKGVSDRYDLLSHRERQVFQLVAEGHSNRAIADILGVSITTIESHRSHVLQKLGLHSAAEVVLYAVRRGIIS